MLDNDLDNDIASAGQRLFELFGACATNPDDVEIGKAADETLRELDRLLIAAGRDR
jgi:hypothetical protein